MNDEQFRLEVRGWLTAQLASAEFACLVGKAGTGRAHEFVAERMAWERRLGADGWIGLGWPEADGGRGLPWHRQVIFYEEYARANAPGRVGHIGEQLVAPTLLMFGTPEQKARFLPGIAARHRAVVPGVLRAGGRVRPRGPAHAGVGARRRVAHRRAEDMDLPGPCRRLVLPARPDFAWL